MQSNLRFLCVELQLREIESRDFHTREILHDLVNKPVQSMEEEYDRIFGRISRLKPDQREAARHIFMWMTYALRPITLEEVGTAFAMDWENFTVKCSVDATQFLLLCGNLVECKRKNNWSDRNILRFIHTSVKDYLRLKGGQLQFNPENALRRSDLVTEEMHAHRVMAMTSLLYLIREGLGLLLVDSGKDSTDKRNLLCTSTRSVFG